MNHKDSIQILKKEITIAVLQIGKGIALGSLVCLALGVIIAAFAYLPKFLISYFGSGAWVVAVILSIIFMPFARYVALRISQPQPVLKEGMLVRIISGKGTDFIGRLDVYDPKTLAGIVRSENASQLDTYRSYLVHATEIEPLT